MSDQQVFINQELVLKVSPSIDISKFNIDKYEPFIEGLCGNREYQKEAIRTALRYLLSGRYQNLKDLAEENFYSNEKIKERYGSISGLESHLQIPDKLCCTIDLATATGKSYVMYGIARIMLAEGVVDQVLILCPSRTIENGLIKKFKQLSSDQMLKDLLPESSVIRNPHIINGTESITRGTICVENFHATLEHVHSSIRESLKGKGRRTLILNDEVHHVYNKPFDKDAISQSFKRWKEFLLDEEFDFLFLIGFSGTCYIENEYFSDVIYSYTLREAIEDGYAKQIDYVAEDTSQTQDEKFQKIYDNHIEAKFKYRKVKPLTIIITRDIVSCKKVYSDLIAFLSMQENISIEDAEKKVLIVTSAREHAPNLMMLRDVDNQKNPIEWITSVSMLTEGWDVQNVFQIVPHEERAFNSKLLIAQVLGRGLRVPDAYKGERPKVIVFNHDAFSSRIKHLVEQVIEFEKRLYSFPVKEKSILDFQIHQIDYSKTQILDETMPVEPGRLTKGYISLAYQTPTLEKETSYESVVNGGKRVKRTLIKYKMYTVDEVAEIISYRYGSIDLETEGATNFSEQYPLELLKSIIRESLLRIGEKEDRVSEENKQILLKTFGFTLRGTAKHVRFLLTPNALRTIKVSSRGTDSTGLSLVRRGVISIFGDELSSRFGNEETFALLSEIQEDDSLPKSSFYYVENSFNFKTPLNIVLADHKPERDFIRWLIKIENAQVIDSWIKSTDQGFYDIEYSWRKGDHSKRGFFNPDFFIKIGNKILVIEIKGNEELTEPSRENKAKFIFANIHFDTINSLQTEFRYYFHFLCPQDFDGFFKSVRDNQVNLYRSYLDVALEEASESI